MIMKKQQNQGLLNFLKTKTIYILVIRKNEVIQCKSFSLILSLPIKYKQVITNLNYTLFLIRENGIDIYGSRNFQHFSSVEKTFSIHYAILSSDYQIIFFLTDDGLIKMHNQHKTKL